MICGITFNCKLRNEILLQVKNETHALWTWHRNQDLYGTSGDQIYIVRQPDQCPMLNAKSQGDPSLEMSVGTRLSDTVYKAKEELIHDRSIITADSEVNC